MTPWTFCLIVFRVDVQRVSVWETSQLWQWGRFPSYMRSGTVRSARVPSSARLSSTHGSSWVRTRSLRYAWSSGTYGGRSAGGALLRGLSEGDADGAGAKGSAGRRMGWCSLRLSSHLAYSLWTSTSRMRTRSPLSSIQLPSRSTRTYYPSWPYRRNFWWPSYLTSDAPTWCTRDASDSKWSHSRTGRWPSLPGSTRSDRHHVNEILSC